GVDADAPGLAGLAVAHEDVAHAVRVAPDEVDRNRVERDEAPIGGDRWHEAGALPLRAVGVGADAGGLAVLAVAYEDVADPVRVALYELGSRRLEGDEAPVGRDRGHDALAFGLRAVGVDAYSGGLAGLAVAHEDVPHAIRIARDE